MQLAEAHTAPTRRSPGLRRAAAPVALVLAAMGVLAASCADDSASNGGAALEGDPVAGEQTYMDFCGSCHGRDFEGSVQGPSHLDARFAPEITTDDDYRSAISNGAPRQNYDFGPMPAIGSLDDQQVEDVIAYVRSVQAERGFDR